MEKVLVRQPMVDLRTGLPTPEWTTWFDNLSSADQVQTTVREVITNIITSGSDLFAGTWTTLDKTGSSLADLQTRNASDLQGNLNFDQLPTGSGTWPATVLFTGQATLTNPKIAGNYILPAISYTTSIGSPFNKFLTIHAAELTVETLVAQEKVATIGGTVLVAPTSFLVARILPADTQIMVKHNAFALNEIVRMKAHGYEEWMRIASTPTGIGPFTYQVERSLGPLAAQPWFDGDAVVSTGVVGAGFIDIFSREGVVAGLGPTIVGSIRNSTTWNDVHPRWAIGNLNGLYGYVVDTIGAAFGDPAGAWIKIDTANGVRIGHSSTTHLQLDALGNASFASGAVTIDGTGIYVTPGTGGAYSVPNAYRFNAVGAEAFGMSASDNGTHRYLFLQAPNPSGAYTHGSVYIGLPLASAMFQTIPLGSSIQLFTIGEISLQGSTTRAWGGFAVYNTGLGIDRFTVSGGTGDVFAAGTIRERNRVTPMGEWASYTPTLGTMTVGNGSVSGRYTRIGTTVHFQIIVIFGTTTSISAAAFTASLPTTFAAGAAAHAPINGVALDSSTSQFYDLAGQAASTSSVYVRQIQPAGVAYITNTVPFTWATGDQIYLWGTYEEV